MKVFLSWSGKRSGRLAATFHSWLPHLFQTVEPFFSPEMEKGTRWAGELSRHLEESSVGVIFLTPENLGSPWLLFEAGALSKHPGEARVYTLLFDLDPLQVPLPLGQFQHTSLSRQEMLKMVLSLRRHLESPPSESVINRLFSLLWPEFEQVAEELREQSVEPARRPPEDSAMQLLSLMKDLVSRISHLEMLLQETQPLSDDDFGNLLIRKDSEFERRLDELVKTISPSS